MFFKIFNCLVRRDKLKLTVQTQKQNLSHLNFQCSSYNILENSSGPNFVSGSVQDNLLPQMEKLHNYIPVRITLYFLYFST